MVAVQDPIQIVTRRLLTETPVISNPTKSDSGGVTDLRQLTPIT
jgi:hypothetical protein